MSLKKIMSFLCLILVAAFAVSAARAQGVIVPIICEARPCVPRPLPRPLPLPNALPVKSINIDTKISGQAATTRVTQIFRNDTPYTLEGTYFFPIPETASIVEFAIWENGKKLVGEVRSREEARRIYDEIVRRQRDPGLLEYAGKDLFQASIFPILPNSEKKLELTFTQVLKAESGTVAYRYPLGTGGAIWNNPRPLVPVRRAIDDERPANSRRNETIGTVSGRVEITAPQALRNIYSPSHSIDVKRAGETKAVITFESNTARQQDFQLFYGLSNNDFGMSLVTYREAGKDGYFLLILSPKDNVLDREIAAKDIVFVIDTSGSMADEGKMEKARAAILFGIRNLRAGDRFNVINFAGEEHLMETGLIGADAGGKRRGEEFVNRLQPSGGTNINDALRAAMRQFDSSDRAKLLVFMTDGLPTVGETDVEKIVQNVKDVKVENLRLFTFGVGYDVNTKLLDKIADENDGAADYVEPKEDLEVKVSNFFTKVSSPVLTGIDLDFGAVEADLIYPRKMPDLFRGTQLTMLGRYRNANDLNNITLRLRGKTEGETKTFNYANLDFPLRREDNAFVPRLWATRRVGWLIEQIRANGENKEIRDEIVQLGTRYGIVTPYTSYLATDGSSDNSDMNNATADLPINSRQVMNSPKSAQLSSGRGAVMASKDAKKKSEAVSLAADKEDDAISVSAENSVRKVGAKTFYLQNGFWTDAEYKSDAKLSERKLTFGSNEFFDLLGREKELAQFFALGEQVVVVWKGAIYRIVK